MKRFQLFIKYSPWVPLRRVGGHYYSPTYNFVLVQSVETIADSHDRKILFGIRSSIIIGEECISATIRLHIISLSLLHYNTQGSFLKTNYELFVNLPKFWVHHYSALSTWTSDSATHSSSEQGRLVPEGIGIPTLPHRSRSLCLRSDSRFTIRTVLISCGFSFGKIPEITYTPTVNSQRLNCLQCTYHNYLWILLDVIP